MEPEQTRKTGHLKRVLRSRWAVWAIALLLVVLLCLSATAAFGMGPFRSDPKPSERMPEVGTDTTPSLLKVVTTDDVANMSTTTPSAEVAAALQTQDAGATPQSTVSGQSTALGTTLSAGVVNLQAGVSTTANALNVNELGW